MPSIGFRLPPEAVDELARETGGTVEQLMLALIPLARSLAQPRLSGFSVGAVAQGSSGTLYFGANSELDASSVVHTVHAEQAAVVCAIIQKETGIEKLAVSAPPCGYCRQFLYELSTADRLLVVLAGKPPTRLTELLPGAFGPSDLGVQGGMPGRNGVELEWVVPGSGPAAEAAMVAARVSYAPYTGAVAGAGLVARFCDGAGVERLTTVGGPYLENAAFNPSLSPLQTSLVALMAASIAPMEIIEAALVQLHDSKVAHADAAGVLLARLAPQVKLQVFTTQRVKSSAPSPGGAQSDG